MVCALTVTDGGRNSKEVGGERVETQPFERECQVGSLRSCRDLESETQDVDRPEVIILETLPKQFGGNGLAVVHIRFGWVLT